MQNRTKPFFQSWSYFTDINSGNTCHNCVSLKVLTVFVLYWAFNDAIGNISWLLRSGKLAKFTVIKKKSRFSATLYFYTSIISISNRIYKQATFLERRFSNYWPRSFIGNALAVSSQLQLVFPSRLSRKQADKLKKLINIFQVPGV